MISFPEHLPFLGKICLDPKRSRQKSYSHSSLLTTLIYLASGVLLESTYIFWNQTLNFPSFHRTKNLKEILAPSKFISNDLHESNSNENGCFKCDKTRCDLGNNFLVHSNRFSSYRTGKSYYIRSHLTYHSRNVIYLASCKKCQLQYIGSTTTEFKVRFINHKSSMLTNKTCEVAVHFNSTPHSLQDFEFQFIDQIAHANSRTLLENTLIAKETSWSAQLFTLSPYGLNKRQEFHSKNQIHYN